MNNLRHYCSRIMRIMLIAAALLSCANWTPAQAQPPRVPTKAPTSPVSPSAPNDERTLGDTRQQLIKLLRMTPTLTGAVAHDPSLLADQQYVTRNNPALAQFLETHPEVGRNPEFYLFANVEGRDRMRGLQREVWPELIREYRPLLDRDVAQGFAFALVFAVILTGLFWLVRLFVENSRWNRSFKTQTEMQSRMLDKFAVNEELIAYLDTDAGKRILQLPTAPARVEHGMLGRMLTPLQIGAVLIPVGIGLQILRRSFPNEGGLLVFGTLALTLGIGLAIAACISWLIARRYGLLVFGSATTRDDNGIGQNSPGQR